jgi:hypothetical protein
MCWVRPGRQILTHYFPSSVGPSADPTGNTLGHVSGNTCFASGVICGSRSAFMCVQKVKRQRTIFHAQVGPVWIP